VPIIFVEAEKSALALTAWAERTGKKILTVAMGGCWGWYGRIGKIENSNGQRVDEMGPLPDLNICRDRRKTYVLIDRKNKNQFQKKTVGKTMRDVA